MTSWTQDLADYLGGSEPALRLMIGRDRYLPSTLQILGRFARYRWYPFRALRKVGSCLPVSVPERTGYRTSTDTFVDIVTLEN